MPARQRGLPTRPPERCERCALRQLGEFAEVSPEELAAIGGARKGTRLYGPASQLYLPGDRAEEAFTLYAGWAFSYQMLDDGRRHILAIHLPGDTVGVQPDLARPFGHGVETLTDAAVCVFDQSGLQALAREHSRLAWHLCWMLAHDRSYLHEHLTNIGRRTAAERVGFLCLELFVRAEQRGLTTGDACPFPLSQGQLADALGLSSVHVSRMLHELRDRGLLEVAHGHLRIRDRAGLAGMCGFRDRFTGSRPLF